MCKPPSDYDLLRSKQIYLFGKLLTFDEQLLNDAQISWFGKVLHFTKEADRNVTVEAI